MKTYLATLLLIFSNFCFELIGQINGVSSSKLCVPKAEILSKGTFEFEPSFSVSHSTSSFNQAGNVVSLQGEQVQSSLAFRITTGLSESFEIGAVIPSTIENISLGAKYFFLDSEKFKSSFLGGLNLRAGNTFTVDSIHNDNHYTISFGNVLSYSINEAASADMMVSYTNILGEHPFNNVFNFQLGVGYNISEEIQIVTELSGTTCIANGCYSRRLSVVPGFAYTVSQKLGLAAGFQYDMIGKNEMKTLGYFAVFTFLFE
jgi:hypothetical protein